MPDDSAPRHQARFLRPCIGLGFLAPAFAVGLHLRGNGGLRLAAMPVEHVETTVPACGERTSSVRRLTVLTAYLAREDADAVAGIVVSTGGETLSVARRDGTCSVGGDSAPCPAEACREGTCAVRVPLPGVLSGPVSVRLLDRDGAAGGAGEVEVSSGRGPPMPPLDVVRDGRTVAIAGEPEAIARVSLVRGGRVTADVPTALDARGRARLTVPEGTDAMRVSVSHGDGGGVSQSSALIPGPFGPGCAG